MADDLPRTLLSVRAEARREVPPDLVVFHTSVSGVAGTRAASQDAAAAALAGVRDDLASLGGQAHTAQTGRHPLTWSAGEIWTRRGSERVDGETVSRYRTIVEVAVTVRDFVLLGPIEQIVLSRDGLAMRGANWRVDADNAGWAAVRADAIHAALRKGGDYAAALGGTVVSVEHVADVGLLDDGGSPQSGRAVSLGFTAQSGGGSRRGSSPFLDPPPQRIEATIEARFVATTGALPIR